MDMDNMEKRLYEAAVVGDIATLNQLLQEDPLILKKATLRGSDHKTPLHIAAMLGHVDFATAILDVSSDMLLARDRDGRNPSHLAAINGEVNVLKVLILARPLAARDRTDGGGTILHLCVKYNQLEVLKTLLENIQDSEFLNTKNDEGMTVLHLAVLDQQIEAIGCLIDTNIDVNAKNTNGKTALDIARSLKSEIVSMLEYSETLRAEETNYINGREWLDKKSNTIMIVATLIATFAFQAGLNPPGGVWQDDLYSQNDQLLFHKAGEAVMAYHHPLFYKNFLRVNTAAFVSSLSIIFLLMSGLPFKRRIFMWSLIAVMWLSTISVALTYGISVKCTTPKDNQELETQGQVIQSVVAGWCFMMSMLLLGNTMGMIRKWNKGREIKKLRSTSRNFAVQDQKNGTQVSLQIHS